MELNHVETITAVELLNKINPEVLGYKNQLCDGFVAIDCSNDNLRIPGTHIYTHNDKKKSFLYDIGEGGGPERDEGWSKVVLFHCKRNLEITQRAVEAILSMEVIDSTAMSSNSDDCSYYTGKSATFQPSIQTIFMVDKGSFLNSFSWMKNKIIQDISLLNLEWRMPSIIPLKLDPANNFQPITVNVDVDANETIPNYNKSYINDRLFLSSLKALKTKNVFHHLNINAVVDLSTYGNNVLDVPNEDYLHLEILDEATNSAAFTLIHKIIPSALEFISRKLVEGKNVVVHCDKGQSRSGACIVAWEMMSRRRIVTSILEGKGIQRNLQHDVHVAGQYEHAVKAVRTYRQVVEPNEKFALRMADSIEETLIEKWENAIPSTTTYCKKKNHLLIDSSSNNDPNVKKSKIG